MKFFPSIGSLPEILPDAWHGKAAQILQKKLDISTLTPSILDTFTNLTLKPDVLLTLRQGVLKSLESASKNDLPIMIKFIVSCVNPKGESYEILVRKRTLVKYQSQSEVMMKICLTILKNPLNFEYIQIFKLLNFDILNC